MSSSSRAPLQINRLAPEGAHGIRVLPVAHERVEIAAVVRGVLDRLRPAGVAVELPTQLTEKLGAAVRRLPRISVLLSEEPGQEALVWVVAPGDPIVEAVRWAQENGRPFFCVDPDVRYRARHRDPVPDPYAIWTLGAEAYLELLVKSGAQRPVHDDDRVREQGMAYFSRQARRTLDGELLVLTGAAHAQRLRALLEGPVARPMIRLGKSSAGLWHLDPVSLTGLMADAPLAHAAWEGARDGSIPEAPELGEALSRKISVARFGLRVITGEGDEDRQLRRRRLAEYAAATAVRAGPAGWAPDRRRLAEVVWRVGAGSLREQTDSELAAWQRRLFFDYSRRHARLQGLLAPGLYEWTVAARGVGDDNLAWEVFDAARTYPWQWQESEIPVARLDGSELDLGSRKIRFRRGFLSVKGRPLRVPVRQRPEPEDPAEWLKGFDAAGICSYPAEDLVIEDYGRFLQAKAKSILAAERSRTEPFSSGLLDGIDLRETLRNPHQDRIYVREALRAPGEAGSVVVIFDRDRDDRLFPFRMTWLGEHDQESDMAFYSTDPGSQVVGPGILRATYGGFMLTMPRGRLFDVWEDPDYRFCREKAEVLCLAAIDYSREKIVVHVAEEAPGERLRRYAGAQGKRLLHVPMASLSPISLRKIRVLHLLAGHDKRKVAKSYVW